MESEALDLTAHWVGLVALLLFTGAYVLVIAEEFTGMRKSSPVILAAGLIWGLIAWLYSDSGATHLAGTAVTHFLEEFAELFLFLLTAMTYVNAMTERNVFRALRCWLVARRLSYRQIFWVTGILSFCISPVLDNLTTALVMSAVILSIAGSNSRFIGVACVNIVVAANAGGAFSPFGDITTLMVWQRGIVEFGTFFALFVPAAVNYLIPAIAMSLAVDKTTASGDMQDSEMKRGAVVIMLLFAATILTAVLFNQYLHLPPFLGMMTGLGYLKFYGYYLRKTHVAAPTDSAAYGSVGDVGAFDSYREIARIEWDTLLFFFGVIMCVGGLGFIGFLGHISDFLYGQWGPTAANTAIGFLSAVIDNIPIMVAVLEMEPAMNTQQWLLVTMTAGVGGSLLSVGSAAGVALMGQAHGHYTFFGHLRWTPVIALGYGASIWVHMLVNAGYAN